MWINKFKVKEKYISFQENNNLSYYFLLCGWNILDGDSFIKTYRRDDKFVIIKSFEFINHFDKIKECAIDDYGESEEQRIYFICG